MIGSDMYLHKTTGKTLAAVDGKSNELEKVNTIYQYVKSQFTWNGEFAAMATQDFKKFLEARKGSSAEMNLILVNLLRQHGIKSDPVLIRTSNLGMPEKMYPVKNQFNHIIATAEIGGSTYLFDITSNSTELNKLNKLDLGTEGWLVREDNYGWIETFPAGKKIPVDEDIPVFKL